jgi:hypothetical protein
MGEIYNFLSGCIVREENNNFHPLQILLWACGLSEMKIVSLSAVSLAGAHLY